MRASVASLSKKFISTLFAATLALSLVPANALAVNDNSLSLIPEGEQDAASIVTSAEGGGDDVFSHYPSNDASSVDGGGVDLSSENADDSEDTQHLVANEFDIINQEVELNTVVAQTESTRNYFLAQTLESTHTVPVVNAKLPIDTGTVIEPVGPGEIEDEKTNEGDDDSDESGLDGAIAVGSIVVGSFEYLGMTFAIDAGGESAALIAADYNRIPAVFIEKQIVVVPDIVTPDGIDYYSVTRIADNAFASFKENIANPDYSGCQALSADEKLLDDAGIDLVDIQQCLVTDKSGDEDSQTNENNDNITPIIISTTEKLSGSDETEDKNNGVIRTIVSMEGNTATFDDHTTYSFTNPLAGCIGILALSIPASVTTLESGTFKGFETLQNIIVVEDNQNYASYDGALYDADLTRLLVIPEGRHGALGVMSSSVQIEPLNGLDGITLIAYSESDVDFSQRFEIPFSAVTPMLLECAKDQYELSGETASGDSNDNIRLASSLSYGAAWTPSEEFSIFAYGTGTVNSLHVIGSAAQYTTFTEATEGKLPANANKTFGYNANGSSHINRIYFENNRLITQHFFANGDVQYNCYVGHGLSSTGAIARVQYSTSVDGTLYDVLPGNVGVGIDEIKAATGITPTSIYVKLSSQAWTPTDYMMVSSYGTGTTYNLYSLSNDGSLTTFRGTSENPLSSTPNSTWTNTSNGSWIDRIYLENGRLICHFNLPSGGKQVSLYYAFGLTSSGGISRVQYSTTVNGNLYDVKPGNVGVGIDDIKAATGVTPRYLYVKLSSQPWTPTDNLNFSSYGTGTTYSLYKNGKLNTSVYSQAVESDLPVNANVTLTNTSQSSCVDRLYFDQGRLVVHFFLSDATKQYSCYYSYGLHSAGGITRVQYSTSVNGTLYDIRPGSVGIGVGEIKKATGTESRSLFLKLTSEAAADGMFAVNWIGNGGSWGGLFLRKGTWATTATAAQTGPGSLPARAGYKFFGWADSATATSSQARLSVKPSSAATYYAIWGIVKTVTLEQQSASSPAKTTTLYYAYGSAEFYTDASCTKAYVSGDVIPTRTGYVFDGYFTTDDITADKRYLTETGVKTGVTDTLWGTASTAEKLYAKWIPVSSMDTLFVNSYGQDTVYNLHRLGSASEFTTYSEAAEGPLPTNAYAELKNNSAISWVDRIYFENGRLIMHFFFESEGIQYSCYVGYGLNSTGGVTRVQFSPSKDGELYEVGSGSVGIGVEDIWKLTGDRSRSLYVKLSSETWTPSNFININSYGAGTVYDLHGLGWDQSLTTLAKASDGPLPAASNYELKNNTGESWVDRIYFENGRLIYHYFLPSGGKQLSLYYGYGLNDTGGITRVQYSTSVDGTLYDVTPGSVGVGLEDIKATTGVESKFIYVKLSSEPWTFPGTLFVSSYGTGTEYPLHKLGSAGQFTTHTEATEGDLPVSANTTLKNNSNTSWVDRIYFENGRLVMHFFFQSEGIQYSCYVGHGINSAGGIARVQYSTSVDGKLHDMRPGSVGLGVDDIKAATGDAARTIYIKLTTEAKSDDMFAVNWIGNGGTWTGNLTRKGTWANASTADLTGPRVLPVRLGYKLCGWSTSPSTAAPEASESVKPTSATTYYAIWGIIKTVTLDQTSATTDATTKALYYAFGKNKFYTDAACTNEYIKSANVVPTRTNYNFEGYYDSANGTAQYIASDGSPTSNITAVLWGDTSTTAIIYPKWSGSESVITWNANSGTFVEAIPTDVIMQTFGNAIKLPPNNPTREGYKFEGWFTGNDFTTQVGVTGGITTVQAGTPTYIAKWGEKVEGTITLKGNGGAFDGGKTEETVTYTVDTIPTTLDDLARPTLTGYAFAGWVPDTGSSAWDKDRAWDADSERYIPQTYTATWTTDSYGITYRYANQDGNALTGCTTDDGSELPPCFDVTTVGRALPIMVKPGYEFEGWTCQDADGNPIGMDGDEPKIPNVAQDIVLIGHFTAKPYVVKVYLVDATESEGWEASYTRTYEDPALLLPATAPKRAGYKFGGFKAYASEDEGSSSVRVIDVATGGSVDILLPGGSYKVLDLKTGDGVHYDVVILRPVWTEHIAVDVPTDVSFGVLVDFSDQKLHFQYGKTSYDPTAAKDTLAPLTFTSYTTAPLGIVAVEAESDATETSKVFGEKANEVSVMLSGDGAGSVAHKVGLNATLTPSSGADRLAGLDLAAAGSAGAPTTIRFGLDFGDLAFDEIAFNESATIARLHYTVAILKDGASTAGSSVLGPVDEDGKKIIW